jgi:hypothetical protein
MVHILLNAEFPEPGVSFIPLGWIGGSDHARRLKDALAAELGEGLAAGPLADLGQQP